MPLAAQTAGLLELNGTLLIELVGFLAMLYVLSRLVYPYIVRAAEDRQRQITEQLETAERSRVEAEQRLREAADRLDQARGQAAEIVAGAKRSGEQLRAELHEKADEESRRITESARQDIEAERRKAVDAVRGEVAELVVTATEKVVGESLDSSGHRRLIEQAIAQVGGSGESNGRRSG
jgi:F-type H+-transporting ATPase subunit b